MVFKLGLSELQRCGEGRAGPGSEGEDPPSHHTCPQHPQGLLLRKVLAEGRVPLLKVESLGDHPTEGHMPQTCCRGTTVAKTEGAGAALGVPASCQRCDFRRCLSVSE